MAFGTTPVSTTTLGTNQFPVSAVQEPGQTNLTALEGGPGTVDGNGNRTAPASVYGKAGTFVDGASVTEGAKADTAITDSTTTNTKMSFLKGGIKILADIWDNVNHRIKVDGSGVTQPVSLSTVLNSGLPSVLPLPVQSTNNKSSGSVASLVRAFSTGNTALNSIIVVCAVGNGTAPTVSDTNGNAYTLASQVANGTACNTAIFYATFIPPGANTVTVTNGGSAASIAMELYEMNGLLLLGAGMLDQAATNSGSSGTATTAIINPHGPNEYAFAGVAVGTAAQTITPGAGWTNDSGQQNPTTPAGLFSFVSMSQFLGSTNGVTPLATFTSEPWAMAAATFRTVVLPIEGTVAVNGQYNTVAPSLSNGQQSLVQMDTHGNVQANLNTLIAGEDQTNNMIVVEERYSYTHISSATTTVVKASPGYLRRIIVNTPGTTNTITVYDQTSAATPTVGIITNPTTIGLPLTYECLMTNGITIVTSATCDITVIWR